MPVKFKDSININGEYTLPLIDGDSGEALITDGAGNISFGAASAASSGLVLLNVKNTSGGALSKGDPVHITGNVGNSTRLEVDAADAADESKMPAVGILTQDLADDGEGTATITGYLKDIDTTTIDGSNGGPGDVVYVKAGGGLTYTKPTGTNLIQNIAKVGRDHENGSLVVSSIMRTNDVPTPMYVDHANQRLGIGTTTPQQRLQIASPSSTSVVLSASYSPTNNNNFFETGISANDGYLNLRNSGVVTTVHIDSDNSSYFNGGNVGIGTTSPSAKLEVMQASPANGIIADFINSTNSSNTTTAIQLSNAADVCSVVLGANRINANYGSDFFISLSDNVDGTNRERFRITESGNVGINTTSPSAKLDVVGGGGSTFPTLELNSSTSLTFNHAINSFNANLTAGENQIFVFGKDGNTRNAGYIGYKWNGVNSANNLVTIGHWGADNLVNIDGNGNVGIGTESPGSKLQVGPGTSNQASAVASLGGSSNSIMSALSLVNTLGNATAGQGTALDFHLNSAYSPTGRIATISENTSVDAALTFHTYSSIGGTFNEKMRITSTGKLKLNTYGSGTHTGTVSKMLAVDTNGNVIETTSGSGSGTVDGTGTTNYVSKWSDSNTLTNGLIYDTGSYIGVGTTSPSNGKLTVSSTSNHIALETGTAGDGRLNIGHFSNGTFIGTYGDDGGAADVIRFGTHSGDERMRITSGGDVSIGTTSVASGAKLTVAGNATITGTSPILKIDGSGHAGITLDRGSTSYDSNLMFATAGSIKWRLWNDGADDTLQIRDEANASEMVTFKSGGNVGIGTTSPAAKLHVESVDNNYIAIFRHSVGPGHAPGSILLEAGQSSIRGQGIYHYNNVANENWFTGVPYDVGSTKWIVANKNNTSQDVSTAQLTHALMTIDSDSGNVGIGTSSPAAKLDVNGAGRFSGGTVVSGIDTSTNVGVAISKGNFLYSDDGDYLRRLIGQSASGAIDIGQGGTGLISDINFYPGSSGNINFLSSSSIDMRVASNGNVGIGTTSPAAKLDVNNNVQIDTYSAGTAIAHNAGYIKLLSDGKTGWAPGDELGKIEFYNKDTSGIGARNAASIRAVNNSGNGSSTTTFEGELAFYTSLHNTAEAEAVRIDSAGNIGIGTTNPASNAKLTVMGNQTFGIPGNGSNTSGRFISIEGNTDVVGEGSSRIFFTEHNSSTAGMDNYGMSIGYRGGGTSITGASGNTWTGLSQISNGEWGMWGHNNNATGVRILRGDRAGTYTAIYSGDVERFRVHSNGNVGIGTTAPAAKLDVAGDVFINASANSSSLKVYRGTLQTLNLWNATNGAILSLSSDTVTDSISLDSRANQNSYINTGGNVGIGTTSPSEKLDVAGNINTTGDIIVDSNRGFINSGDWTRNATAHGYIDFGPANTNHAHIYTDRPNFYFNKQLSVLGSTVWNSGNDGSGSGLNADLLDGLDSTVFYRQIAYSSGTAGPGWVTVAKSTTARGHSDVIVSDGESGDHSFIQINWLRSYNDSSYTVINTGGHQNRITGVRVLQDTGDITYGIKYLQVYVTTSSNYYVRINKFGNPGAYTNNFQSITPVVENSKTGYGVHGIPLTALSTYNFGASQGVETDEIKAHGTITAVEGIARQLGGSTTAGVKFWSGTKAQYDALGSGRDANTIYYVTDE